MTSSKGFTLIELLVVIAIIGVLSSIVVSSLSNSRNKALDAKIKSQMSHIRAGAELYYGAHDNYGSVNNALCSSQVFSETSVAAEITSLLSMVTLTCRSSATAYAISAPLQSESKHWCVDSKNNSKKIDNSLGNGIYECP